MLPRLQGYSRIYMILIIQSCAGGVKWQICLIVYSFCIYSLFILHIYMLGECIALWGQAWANVDITTSMIGVTSECRILLGIDIPTYFLAFSSNLIAYLNMCGLYILWKSQLPIFTLTGAHLLQSGISISSSFSCQPFTLSSSHQL